MRLFVFALCLAQTFEIKEEAQPPHKAQHMLLELKSDMTLSKCTPMQILSGVRDQEVNFQ